MKYIWQYSQDVVQPSKILYEVHQHISVNIDITFTNVLIKFEFNDNTVEDEPVHMRDIWTNTQDEV